ncbi:MAG: hypothetical protein WC119_02360 [Synergistaceae bacterium]
MNFDDISGEYKYMITVQYKGQSENEVALLKNMQNAFLVSRSILNELHKTPIIRILDIDKKECIGAFQKEIKELEKKTEAF